MSPPIDRRLLLRPIAFGLITAAAILSGVWQVKEAEQGRRLQEAHAKVLRTASLIRARLEGSINSHIFLARGMVAYVASHPTITQDEFVRIARELIKGHADVRSIQLARNSIITHIYPIDGNEAAQGLRLLELPAQSPAVRRAIDSGRTVVAGPVDLVQGGSAFISRTPIYRSSEPGSSDERQSHGPYWGLASLLLDRESLFREANIEGVSAELRLAIRGRDGLGSEGGVFYGDPAVFESEPVRADIVLPNGSWELAAVPRSGWQSAADAVQPIWIPGVLFAATGGWLIGLLAYRPQKMLQVNRQLVVARREAERAAEDRSRFLAAASHDLRQPLHALTIFIGDLHERSHHLSELRPLVEKVSSTAEALNELLFSLMDISKLDAKAVRPEIQEFPLQPLLERLSLENAPTALRKRLRFRSAGTRAFCRSDPMLLENLLRNLIVNAVKYTEHGGVLVGCRRRGDRLRIEVWDTGPGIPADEHDNIFGEFYQLDNPGHDRRKGLGLGLAIVKRISEMLEHPVEVRSCPGRGTVFSVETPRGTPVHVQSNGTSLSPAAYSLRNLTVVVIDDEILVLDAVGSLLDRWGCRVLTAERGDQAIRAVENLPDPPSLILCDYQLSSGETGDAVIRELRKKTGEDIPAVLISGDTSEEARRAAEAIGCRLWRKPVAPAKLRALLRNVTRGREQADA